MTHSPQDSLLKPICVLLNCSVISEMLITFIALCLKKNRSSVIQIKERDHTKRKDKTLHYQKIKRPDLAVLPTLLRIFFLSKI